LTARHDPERRRIRGLIQPQARLLRDAVRHRHEPMRTARLSATERTHLAALTNQALLVAINGRVQPSANLLDSLGLRGSTREAWKAIDTPRERPDNSSRADRLGPLRSPGESVALPSEDDD
jgi:hypothetical protein